MLIVISPAKSLDYKTEPVTKKYTIPEYLDKSEVIIEKLRKLKPKQIADLMNISADLAELNFERFQTWHPSFSPQNAKQAVLAFNGAVFQGLNANTLTEDQFELAQKNLRILSGLHGALKPLDLIQPYRLEMGTSISIQRKKDLYAFWTKQITEHIAKAIKKSGSNYLINLASNEYYKSIDIKKLDTKVITPQFKDHKNGTYKMITIYAKKARGMMTRFILENNISQPEDLQAFDTDGYVFNPQLTKGNTMVFTRG